MNRQRIFFLRSNTRQRAQMSFFSWPLADFGSTIAPDLAGGSMHIPPEFASIQSINLDAAVDNKRAAETQRSKELRKRLLQSTESLDAEADPDAILLIGQWLGEQPAQPLPGDEYTPSNGRDPDFD
jgi:hypothetical protein